MTTADPLDIVALGDVHLGAAGGRRRDQALIALLDDAARREGSRVVFLGDFLDFLAVDPDPDPGPDPDATGAGPAAPALAALDRIVARHLAVFEALARLVARGRAVDVVVGNHDVELARPEVEAGLRDVLASLGAGAAAAAGGRLALRRWILYEPGVLYAEHGHQYHDVNSFDAFLEPFDAAGRTAHPLVVRLAGHVGRRRESGLVRLLAGLAGEAGSLGGRARRRGRADYRAGALRRYATEAGLSHASLVALDRLAEPTLRSVTARAARLAASSLGGIARGRRRGAPRPGAPRSGYLHTAARTIHASLAGRGEAVPCYVFGHTHVAEEVRIGPPGPGAAAYLNAGNWAGDRPDGYHVVRVRRDRGGAVRGWLEQWSPAGRLATHEAEAAGLDR